MSRVRRSIQQIQSNYDSGMRTELENLIRAFRGIYQKPADDDNSFFKIAGYHGLPFRGPGTTNPNYWGGYCCHNNVLFPTWHRAQLYTLENALRSIPGCQDVTLPFWDECFDSGDGLHPIPAIFTQPTFNLDGRTDNPLFSYKLAEAVSENIEGDGFNYSKPVGYETVRHPLSGMVATEKDKQHAAFLAQTYSPEQRTNELNKEVSNWLNPTRTDITSVRRQFKNCLLAPNYTAFSNRKSAQHWNQRKHDTVVALEVPHNGIHLAVGGNLGDMAHSETAGFDPIFFFHHCFIDYVFWTWQKIQHRTTAGSLSVQRALDGMEFAGTKLDIGMPNMEKDQPLTMDTPLNPFMKSNRKPYTSNDVTDIADLGYSYGPGSLDPTKKSFLVAPQEPPRIVRFKRIHNISRADHPGSFVVHLYAKGPGQDTPLEINKDAIFSRWNVSNCRNCVDKLAVSSMVAIDEQLERSLRGNGRNEDIKYWVEIETATEVLKFPPGEGPIIDDIPVRTSSL